MANDTARDWAQRLGWPARRLEPLVAELAAMEAPMPARTALERLTERLHEEGHDAAALDEPLTQRALARLAYAAPFLVRYLTGRGELLAGGVLSDLEAAPALEPLAARVAPAEVAALEPEALQRCLRRWKYESLLRLTAQHLLGRLDTAGLCDRVSELAGQVIRTAYEYAFARLAAEQGLPVGPEGALAAGAVVGMGKLGGGELNYSSDVDLIFIHDGEEALCRPLADPPAVAIDPAADPEACWGPWEAAARTAPAPAGEAMSGGEFHDRLARRVVALVSARTDEGFGFRVDLDLRPRGRSGLLAPSLDFLSEYYDIHGREWERTALLKARRVAGHPAVYEPFRRRIRPFVYRRYLDYGAIEGITLVKRDIDRHNRRGLADNLKLGKGGIRENEFFVQAMQLLYGGKRPELQVSGHEAALRRLAEAGVLAPEVAEAHRADYWVLREVECHIQMVNEAQTHDLPRSAEDRARVLTDFAPGFARERLEAAEGRLARARQGTEERFAGLLVQEEQPTAEAWRHLFDERLSEAMRAEATGRLDTLFARLMETRAGEACALKVERLLGRPELYREGSEAAFPRWLEFLERIGNRNTLYAMLEAHPAIAERVSTVFAEGGRFASHLVRHPEFVESFLGTRDIADGFAEAARHAQDEEEFILEVQSLKSQSFIQVLAGFLEAPERTEHEAALSAVADAVVRACLAFAWRRHVERFGPPEPGAGADRPQGFAVLAMGKLGSREMRFGSDLDLVYCYRADGTTPEGRSHFEWYTKLAQKLNALLTAQTQFGRLYELDHRLRPFGAKGMLVPTLAAYRNFLDGAEVWNFQALTRIRPLAGDDALAGELVALVGRAWRDKAVPPGELAAAVADMLRRLVAEHAPAGDGGAALPVKYAVGGLIGVEFLQQFHALRAHAAGEAPWGEVPRVPVLERLWPGYRRLSRLDERLSLYEPRYRHEVRPEHFEKWRAIGERWRYDEVAACLEEQEATVEQAFREHMA